LRNESFEIDAGEVFARMLQPEREILSNTILSTLRIFRGDVGRVKDVFPRDSDPFLWD